MKNYTLQECDNLTLEKDGKQEIVVLKKNKPLTLNEIAHEIRIQSSWGANIIDGVIQLVLPVHTGITSIHSLDRGHLITPDENGGWVYEDNGEKCENKRPCKRCGKPPTPEGYDACIGYLEGIQYACCGHGVTAPVRIYKEWK